MNTTKKSTFTQFVEALLPDVNISPVIEELNKLGFCSREDLTFLEPEKDLKNVMNILQCRKMAAKLKNSSDVTSPPEQNECPPTEDAGPQNSCNSIHEATWASGFVIPWEMMPKTLMNACYKAQRPTIADVRSLVKVVGEKIWLQNQKPGKCNLRTIAQIVVSKYPRTFQDEVPGVGILGDGLTTLANRLTCFIDNKNRQPGNSLRRKIYEVTENSEDGSIEENGVKRKRLSGTQFAKDSYGCVKWQPSQLPRNENHETQEEHRTWLIQEYSKSEQDSQKVVNLMQITYASQRFTINEASKSHAPILEILTKWPYLKKPEFLLSHFKELMDLDLMSKIDDQLNKKADDILKAAELVNLSTTLEMETPKVTGVLLLLHLLLKDSQSLFSYRKDESVPLENDGVLHPHVVITGNHPFNNNCSVVVEGAALCPGMSLRLATGVAFASFYVFNLTYPDTSVTTLEFIQRVLLGINPLRGSKGAARKKGSTLCKVTKFVTDINGL